MCYTALMKTIALILLLVTNLGFAFSCYDPQVIHQKPILFNQERMQLTRQYQLSHYGIKHQSIEIEPKMIVLHWTCIPTFKATFNTFNPPAFPRNSLRRKELPDDLNVSSQFVVDRDGTIYQLMPETWMARHVIGLNHYAIGIENIGGINGKDDLTEEQVRANAFLVCYLKKKYPAINHVIGHKDYLNYKNTPLWLEKDPTYQHDKMDPGATFVARVKKQVAASTKA